MAKMAKMKHLIILVLLGCTFLECTMGASKSQPLVGKLEGLNKNIEFGKSKSAASDRDMHQLWDEYRQQKNMFELLFDKFICTSPEKLRTVHDEMQRLSKKVELAWWLKQDQLQQLKEILVNENYTDTGLATGNDKVADACKGLNEYIDMANTTAHEEKIELDQHLKEVVDFEIKMDTHPCPCVWGQWEEWSGCTTTCGAGKRYRERVVETLAINNGTDCQGEMEEDEECNEDICCPVDCVWGQWEEWAACPSGCPPQEKIRIRSKAVLVACNGNDCLGDDFEEKSCSREEELLAQVSQLEMDIHTCENPSVFQEATNVQTAQSQRCVTSIRVTDATNSNTLSGATVTYIIAAGNEQSAQTGSDGIMALSNLGSQTVSLTVEKQLYDPRHDEISLDGSCGTQVEIPLNPTSTDGRIVMTWFSNSPADIDIYLASNQHCDIFYGRKTCGQNTLDQDNTIGGLTGGPETITIKEYKDGGKYAVYVHQFGSQSMCTARAKVIIYPGSGRPSQTVEIPSECGGSRYWLVGCYNSETRLDGFQSINQVFATRPTLALC